MKKIFLLNPRFCFICLDSPHLIRHVPFAPCVVSSCDQTLHAVRAVCEKLQKK